MYACRADATATKDVAAMAINKNAGASGFPVIWIIMTNTMGAKTPSTPLML
jgi:hypothetical protein